MRALWSETPHCDITDPGIMWVYIPLLTVSTSSLMLRVGGGRGANELVTATSSPTPLELTSGSCAAEPDVNCFVRGAMMG